MDDALRIDLRGRNVGDGSPAVRGLAALARVMDGARLVKTVAAGRSRSRPRTGGPASGVASFVWLGDAGQATMEHLGASDHQWKVEPHDGPVARLRIVDALPTGLSREDCLHHPKAVHAAVADLDARVAEAFVGGTDGATVTAYALALHVAAQRAGFAAVSTTIRPPVSGDHAVAYGSDADSFRVWEVSSAGGRRIGRLLGRRLAIGREGQQEPWTLHRTSVTAKDADLEDVVTALRAHAASASIDPSELRPVQKR